MNIKSPKGRQSLTTPEQIIDAYKKCSNVSKICRDLHVGDDRVTRVLDQAGIKIKKRTGGFKSKKDIKKKIPENYVAAIFEYQNGVAITELASRHGINNAQLYRWMDTIGVKRRSPPQSKRLQECCCWECGVSVDQGNLFCCDEHRRAYSDAAVKVGFVPPVHHRQEAQKPCLSIESRSNTRRWRLVGLSTS